MRHVLPNGLTAILVENHAAPVAAIQVWVRVGSADEAPDEAGLAHLHEHMLFKGTARRKPGEIARDVEARGGEINAWTSYDETVYHLVLASEFFTEGLDVLADAIQASTFDADELRRETEVVVEEIKRSQDMPARRLSRDLFALAFEAHPYRRPVIGTEQSVRSFDRPKILGFYRRHYTPSRLTLVAVGDFDEARALREVERLWGGQFGAPASPPARTPEPAQRAARARFIEDDLREAHLAAAWHAPDLRHRDVPALDLLGIILGQGDSSRLSLNVKRGQELATEAHAYCYAAKDAGLTVAGMTVAGTRGPEALRALLNEVQRLREQEVSEEELATAKRQLEAEAIYLHETVQGWARRLGYYEAVAGSLEFEREYLARIHATPAAALRAAAQSYLGADRVSIAGLVPKGFPLDDRRALEIAAEALRPVAAAPPVEARPTAEVPAFVRGASSRPEPLQKFPLPGGGTLLVERDASVPVAAFRAVYPGGLRWTSEAQCGIDRLLARLLTQGAAGRSAESIAREIDRMAGGLGGSAGRNSFGLQGEFLSRFFPEAFGLFLDCLLRPDLAEPELEKERAIALQEIHSRQDHPSGVAFELFAKELYRSHPYRLSLLGEAASVSRLGRGDLETHLRRIASPRALTLAVTGDVDPGRVLEEASLALSSATWRDESVAPAPAPEPRPTEPRRAVQVLAKAQAHLVLGFLGVRVSDPQRFDLDVLSAVLSGQGGRLFIELRDKRSLAYSVSSMNVEGLDPGYFAVYMGTSPEKVDAAVEGVREELARVRDSLVPAPELDRARRYLIGSHAIGLQRRSASAGALAFDQAYGLGAEEHRRYGEHVSAVTAEQVRTAAQTLLDPRGEVLAIVGPGGAGS
ncbi:MAG TPA: pitrilysin family protein [Myxococcales bacterium]|nr:pitrilysin family protein [Myxococcales bacterium]